MLAVLQFYVSSFWVWLGITYGMMLLGECVAAWIAAWRRRP